jgi:PAS domain S-box-containing protein
MQFPRPGNDPPATRRAGAVAAPTLPDMPATEAVGSKTMSNRRCTVLLVDHDPDARLSTLAALRQAGFDVRTAEGGHDALVQFRAAPCEIVMLDGEMPDLDGHEVCRILRSEAGPLLPIVMVTGADDVQAVERAHRHTATDFMPKPINRALLGHRLRWLLRSQQTLVALRDAQARNAAILDAIPDLLFELDADGRCLEHRAPRGTVAYEPAQEALGRPVTEVWPRSAAQACMRAVREAQRDGASRGVQFEMSLPDGRRWYELSVARKAVGEGELARFIVLSRDITERKEAEERIARLAYIDSLTGLPNRPAFLERADREITRAARYGAKLAILFMDLDGFKGINDTLGHAAGDRVLRAAAERLQSGLRPSDLVSRPVELEGEGVLTSSTELARLGGDEFTALLCDIGEVGEALQVAQRICALMRRPYRLDDREVTLSASVGIAVYPDDGLDAATLLQRADTAMYHAKTSGRDNAQVYRVSLTDKLVQRMDLEASLRLALPRQELHLEYQPQVDPRTGRVVAVEALLRWTHPARGAVPPLEFIPLAEANGLIDDIGEWVLVQACRDAARWIAAGADVGVAVNLSPRQLDAPDFARRVALVLAQTGLAPQRLELELTEGALLEHAEHTRSALVALRRLGVRVALDDFGTGYSSLAYLTRLPIDHIKIDRGFVAGLDATSRRKAIVRAVLAMAQTLNLRVTAEGVETADQAALLRDLGCHGLQGWHFGRPMRIDALRALLPRGAAAKPAGAPQVPASA